jgi:hypothetical protein
MNISVYTSAPIFDYHYVAYVKDDPAREPITVGASIPAVLADDRVRPVCGHFWP